ncbi:outer membrane transport energization protein TonB [Ancylobacter aquaticus]|uniref:Outer membrane transport energization protein TonB n=1 Tax=Ancylobacter aquaticus TaxID=100 RepID=A0A4R1IBC0_ANCAQ|nr:energy transducer TonB [Ancylobacter aquaticus]TCK31355.1 outer membrane transport energization protein TonB [Ancylobacter aquaticus]
MSLLLLRGNAGHRLREASGWVVCGAVVLAVHGGALGYMLTDPPIVAAEEPAAIMIELAEMPVAPAAEPVELPPGPQMVEAPEEVQEETPPDPLAEEVEDTPPPEPPPVEEPVPEVSESPAETIEVPLPPRPPEPSEIPPPEKKPDPPKERPKPKPKPKEREKNNKPPAPRTSAAPSVQARDADRIAAPTSGASSSASRAPANWRSRLMAHLNRHKRYPGGEGGGGRAMVAFSINRSGQVLSAQLARSSGNPRFDEEAVAMLRRASPLPAPPPEVGGSTIRFTVPVNFTQP